MTRVPEWELGYGLHSGGRSGAHVINPREILEKSYAIARKYLIIQPVVSMSTEAADHFETPAPGRTWGDLEYEIIDQHFNELEVNKRLEERRSLYYRIKVRNYR